MRGFLSVVSLLLTLTSFGQADTTSSCEAAARYYANYRFNAALEAYEACCKLENAPLNCRTSIAQCQVQLGRYADARKTYQEFLDLDSTSVAARNQLARLYRKTGDDLRAREQYRTLLLDDTTNAYYHRQIADCSLELGDVFSALGHLQQAHRLNPKDITAITDMARIFYGLDVLEAADSVIAIGRSLDPAYVPLLLQGVKSAYRQKDYKSVVEHVEQILTISRDSSAYLLKLLGVSAFHIGENDRAIEALEKVIAGGQNSEVVYYYLGLALRESGRPEASASAFQSAIEAGTSKNLDNYYTDMAVAFEEMGDHQSAIRAYQAAYKSNGNEILLYHLARNYDAYYEDKETALRYYERFLAANDSNSSVYTDYTEHRINELKQVMHFDIDTLE